MKRFKNVLCVIEQSSDVHNAVHKAIDVAERNDAKLTLFMVLEKIPSYVAEPTAHVLRDARMQDVEAELAELSKLGSRQMKIEAKIVEGTPFLEIIREVQRHERDLVVKSAQQDVGVMGRLFGTTDMHVLRKCPCPVWLLKPSEPKQIRQILAAVDFNEIDPRDQAVFDSLNRKIMELAGSLAALHEAELHVVHAWNPVGLGVIQSQRSTLTAEEAEEYVEDFRLMHQQWLDHLMLAAEKWLGHQTYQALKLKTHLLKGRAREVIPSLVGKQGADLIVIGTVGRTGINGLLMGNTAESVLNQIDCSVLALKPDEFETPVTLED
jgi:nucleotide-binding universal stress UspA family protein